MKKYYAIASIFRVISLLFVLLALHGQIAFAQNQVSELDSDELMRTVVSLGSDPEFKRGNPEKKIMFEAYLQELMNRAKTGQPSAMFNFGFYRYQICTIVKAQGMDASGAPMCTQAFDDIKAVAENEKIRIIYMSPASMSLLGEMYLNGIGTKPSRYLAADWYIKSAKQQEANGDREGSIRALEEALNIIPDHPVALQLRARLLK